MARASCRAIDPRPPLRQVLGFADVTYPTYPDGSASAQRLPIRGLPISGSAACFLRHQNALTHAREFRTQRRALNFGGTLRRWTRGGELDQRLSSRQTHCSHSQVHLSPSTSSRFSRLSSSPSFTASDTFQKRCASEEKSASELLLSFRTFIHLLSQNID